MFGQPFIEEYLVFVALTLLLVLSGLAIKLLTSVLGIMRMQRHAFVLDELIGQLLHRRDFLQTFIRICAWNIMISSIIFCSGALTLGVLPLVWAFINLGLFFPDANLFRLHLYLWIEETANILSVALGIWIGQNLYALSENFQIFVWTSMSIFSLYVVSSLLETFEIHNA